VVLLAVALYEDRRYGMSATTQAIPTSVKIGSFPTGLPAKRRAVWLLGGDAGLVIDF